VIEVISDDRGAARIAGWRDHATSAIITYRSTEDGVQYTTTISDELEAVNLLANIEHHVDLELVDHRLRFSGNLRKREVHLPRPDGTIATHTVYTDGHL
jgi:3-dehydroquinate dehydratase